MNTQQLVAGVTLAAMLAGCATVREDPSAAQVAAIVDAGGSVSVDHFVPPVAGASVNPAIVPVAQVAPAPTVTAADVGKAVVNAAGIAVAVLAVAAAIVAPQPTYLLVPVRRCNFWRCW
jgi:hypothetical protein